MPVAEIDVHCTSHKKMQANSNHQSGGLFLFIRSNIRYIFLYIKTSSCLTRKNKDMHVIVFQSLRNMDLGTKEGQHITVLWFDCEWYHSF
ncbi:hypothetical protein ACSS6N_23885 [Peribacillus frigoritolerans]|uniref:hypothetical protein n=1 Tax=Peribacillus frigoritolerans TaxID=450367 RepID=UPI003F84A326